MAKRCGLLPLYESLEDAFPNGGFQVEGADVVSVKELHLLLGYGTWYKFIADYRLDWEDDRFQMHVGPLVITTVDYIESPMTPSHAGIATDAGLEPEKCFGGILRINQETGELEIDGCFTASTVSVRLGHRAEQAYKLAIAVSEAVGVTVIQPEV